MGENQVSSEGAFNQGVVVKYEGINPAESLLTVNEQQLNQTLLETDPSRSSAVKSFVITNGEIGLENYGVARFDLFRKAVVINIPTLTKDLQRLHTALYSYVTEPKSGAQNTRGLIQGFLNSKFARLINPVYWPHLGLKQKGVLRVNKERTFNYFESAKRGFYRSKDGTEIPLSQERVSKHLDQVFAHASRRYLGEILAHEAEHGKNPNRKMAVSLGAAFAPLAAAFILQSLFPSNPDANTLSGLSSILLPFVGLTLGRRLDERSSYEAADKYAEGFTRCFYINNEVFVKEVLGESPKISSR